MTKSANVVSATSVFEKQKMSYPYRDATINFYVCFGRFEASLTHLYRDCFKKDSTLIDQSEIEKKIQQKCEDKINELKDLYIFKEPPKKLQQLNGNLEWKEYKPNPIPSLIGQAIRHIFTVRNNLFHGSKHLGPEGNNERNEKLINDALKIIKIILEQDAELSKIFHGDE